MGTSKSSMNINLDERSHEHSSSSHASARLPNENSEEIREEIASTRDRMDETLDELGNRLNPRRLIDDAMQLFSSSGTRETAAKAGESAVVFSENLGRAVRDNPVPALLIGAGLAWLAFGNSGPSQSTARSGRRASSRSREMSAREDERFAGGGMYRGRPLYDLEEDFYFIDEYADEQNVGLDDEAWGDLEDTDLESVGTGAEWGSGEKLPSDDSHESFAARAKRVANQTAQSAGNAASSAGETVAGAASTVSDTVKDAASVTAGAVSSAASALTSGLAIAGESVVGAAKQTLRRGRRASSEAYRYSGRARRGVSREFGHQQEHVVDLLRYASHRYERATETYPLAMGMGCLAIGMLAGLIVPNTQYEDEWMGDASDELKHELQESGQQVVRRGKQVVAGAASQVAKSADEHGLTGGDLLERGERVVAKVVTAASEALREEHLTSGEVVENVKQVGNEAAEQIHSEASHLAGEASEAAGKADPDLKRALEGAEKTRESSR